MKKNILNGAAAKALLQKANKANFKGTNNLQKVQGYYYSSKDNTWYVFDNRSGDFYVENYPSKEIALKYINETASIEDLMAESQNFKKNRRVN